MDAEKASLVGAGVLSGAPIGIMGIMFSREALPTDTLTAMLLLLTSWVFFSLPFSKPFVMKVLLSLLTSITMFAIYQITNSNLDPLATGVAFIGVLFVWFFAADNVVTRF